MRTEKEIKQKIRSYNETIKNHESSVVRKALKYMRDELLWVLDQKNDN